MQFSKCLWLAGLQLTVASRFDFKSSLISRQPSVFNGTANSSAPVIYPMSSDSYFSFFLTQMLALANGGGSATSEVLRAASQITPSDFESVYSEFKYLADAINRIAVSADAKKNAVSARGSYFRASSYYRAADFFLHGNTSDTRIDSLWNSALSNFDNAIALMDIPGERVNVSAMTESGINFTVPITFYKASKDFARVPTLLVGSGYDASQEDSFHYLGWESLARGWNFATYEGPGQPTVRRQQHLGFIPDWWNVVTPAVTYLRSRADVDASRVALIGVSFGGTLAPLAASKESRLAAVLAFDGLHNMSDAIATQLPAKLINPFIEGNVTYFDAIMNFTETSSSVPSQLRWLIGHSKWAFTTNSPFDWFTRLKNISLTSEIVSTINCPVFIAKGEDDTTTGSEPEETLTLLQQAGNDVTFHEFATVLGAGEHCQLGAEPQLAQAAFDWLHEVFGTVAH